MDQLNEKAFKYAIKHLEREITINNSTKSRHKNEAVKKMYQKKIEQYELELEQLKMTIESI